MKERCRPLLCASALGTLRDITLKDKSEMNETARFKTLDTNQCHQWKPPLTSAMVNKGLNLFLKLKLEVVVICQML